MKLSEKLIYLRKEKGITQLGLAEKMNVSRQAISRWEVEDAVPSIENLKFLSKLYGVSLEMLLDEKESVLDQPETPGGEQATPKKMDKKERRKKGIAVFLILLLAAASVFTLEREKKIQQIPIEEMEEEKVDTSTGGDFHFEW